jgi:hypothetical protein
VSIIAIILVKEHVHIFIELSSTSLVLLLEKTSNQNVTSDKNEALIGQFGGGAYIVQCDRPRDPILSGTCFGDKICSTVAH